MHGLSVANNDLHRQLESTASALNGLTNLIFSAVVEMNYTQNLTLFQLLVLTKTGRVKMFFFCVDDDEYHWGSIGVS